MPTCCGRASSRLFFIHFRASSRLFLFIYCEHRNGRNAGEHHLDMQENIHKTRMVAGEGRSRRALNKRDNLQGCLREKQCRTSWASSIRSRRIPLTAGFKRAASRI
jgi:hypothetical protein